MGAKAKVKREECNPFNSRWAPPSLDSIVTPTAGAQVAAHPRWPRRSTAGGTFAYCAPRFRHTVQNRQVRKVHVLVPTLPPENRSANRSKPWCSDECAPRAPNSAKRWHSAFFKHDWNQACRYPQLGDTQWHSILNTLTEQNYNSTVTPYLTALYKGHFSPNKNITLDDKPRYTKRLYPDVRYHIFRILKEFPNAHGCARPRSRARARVQIVSLVFSVCLATPAEQRTYGRFTHVALIRTERLES